MKEIQANKEAWDILAKDHYKTFKKRLEDKDHDLNEIIISELKNIKDKRIIHLQCNTGFDTILLSRKEVKEVVGVDFSKQNIYYANQLKKDFNIKHVSFIESDVLDLINIHKETYDIVYTSEGVLGWIPDINKWAKVVSSLLNKDGYVYIFDSHPIFMTLDEEKLDQSRLLEVKYPYFSNSYDTSSVIGGYASDAKEATNHFWSHKTSDIISALANAGLMIEFFHEFDSLFWNNGQMKEMLKGMYQYEDFKDKLPFSYSIKARKI